jgi:hypothetical protein
MEVSRQDPSTFQWSNSGDKIISVVHSSHVCDALLSEDLLSGVYIKKDADNLVQHYTESFILSKALLQEHGINDW